MTPYQRNSLLWDATSNSHIKPDFLLSPYRLFTLNPPFMLCLINHFPFDQMILFFVSQAFPQIKLVSRLPPISSFTKGDKNYKEEKREKKHLEQSLGFPYIEHRMQVAVNKLYAVSVYIPCCVVNLSNMLYLSTPFLKQLLQTDNYLN